MGDPGRLTGANQKCWHTFHFQNKMEKDVGIFEQTTDLGKEKKTVVG